MSLTRALAHWLAARSPVAYCACGCGHKLILDGTLIALRDGREGRSANWAKQDHGNLAINLTNGEHLIVNPKQEGIA